LDGYDARALLVDGSNSLPTYGLPNGGEFGVHTYLVKEVGVICWRVDELTVLDVVVRLHLPVALQVEVWSIGIFYSLLLLLPFHWLCFFVFMHRASFGLRVALA
jgi:hypothetical protein